MPSTDARACRLRAARFGTSAGLAPTFTFLNLGILAYVGKSEALGQITAGGEWRWRRPARRDDAARRQGGSNGATAARTAAPCSYRRPLVSRPGVGEASG